MRRFDDDHSLSAPHSLPNRSVLNALLELVGSHDIDYARFCNRVEAEPAVAGRIMRAARSILAGRHNGVQELRHAVAIIGLRRVQEILEAIGRELSEETRQ